MVRGRIEVNSFFSQTRSHPVGVLREEGGPFSGSQCRRGALFPLVSQAQLCAVSEEPPPRNRASVPVWSEEVSGAPSHGGSSVSL